MWKYLIRVLSFILFILLMFQMTGCASLGVFLNTDKYVDNDYNIAWIEASRVIKRTRSPQQVFYKIKNVPKYEYVGCVYREYGFGGWHYPFVQKHKDFEGSLELDITSAKMYLGGFTGDPRGSDYSDLGNNIIMQQEVAQVNSTIAAEVVNALNFDMLEHQDLTQLFGREWLDYYDNYLGNDEYSYLRLVLPVKEYDNLIWHASIIHYDTCYLIEIIKNHRYGDCEYLICSKELAVLIEEVSEEYCLRERKSH